MKLKTIHVGLILIAAGIFLSGCSGPKTGKDPAANADKPIELSQPLPENTEKEAANMRESFVKEQESKDYKAIKDREKRMPYAGLVGDDYERIITLVELADRIAGTYNFIATYPDSPYKEEITMWKSEYLHEYLFGNFKYTSSFDWMNGSNIFLKEHLKSYEDSKVKYKGTAFVSTLDEYTNLIKNEGNRMTDKVRDFAKKNSKYEEAIFKCPN